MGESLEVFAGHVESLPEAQPLVKGLGVVGGWSASEGDVPRAVVEAVGDGFRHLVIDVAGINLVAHVALDAVETLLNGVEASVQRFAHVGGFSLRDAGESLGDGFSHDGDESVLEGGCESLGEEAGDGVVHGGVGLVGVVMTQTLYPIRRGGSRGGRSLDRGGCACACASLWAGCAGVGGRGCAWAY